MKIRVVLLAALVILSTPTFSVIAMFGSVPASGLVAHANSDHGGIVVVGTPSVTPSSPSVECTVGIEEESEQLDVTASNLFPGSSCSFQYELKNSHGQTASLSRTPSGIFFAFSNSVPCFQYTDNLPSSLGRKQSVIVRGSITMPSGSGNSCQNAHAETEVRITATYGNEEKGSHRGEHDDESH